MSLNDPLNLLDRYGLMASRAEYADYADDDDGEDAGDDVVDDSPDDGLEDDSDDDGETNPYGGTTTFVSDPNGPTTEQELDADGHVRSTTTFGTDGSVAVVYTDPSGNITGGDVQAGPNFVPFSIDTSKLISYDGSSDLPDALVKSGNNLTDLGVGATALGTLIDLGIITAPGGAVLQATGSIAAVMGWTLKGIGTVLGGH